jgi:hypothetical protein
MLACGFPSRLLVRPVLVVVERVFGQELLQMRRPEDQHPVQEFTA